MSRSFEDLGPEGRIAKIRQHIGTGHPVPSSWVRWLIGQADGLPDVADVECPAGAFDGPDDGQKLDRMRSEIAGDVVPGPWVEWLLDKQFPESAVAPLPK